MTRKTLLLSAAAIGLLAFGAVYLFVFNKPHVNVAKAEARFEGTAAELLQTLEAGGPDAEALIGAVVAVVGTVESVAQTESSHTLTLDAGNPMGGGLSAAMAEGYSPSSDLEGNSIRLKGLCAGLSEADEGLLGALGSNVQLTDCILDTP